MQVCKYADTKFRKGLSSCICNQCNAAFMNTIRDAGPCDKPIPVFSK